MLRLVLFCAVVALVRGETTPVYRQCVNNKGELPVAANIGGCDRAPCLLPQLQDFTMSINFKTPNTVYFMRTLATAYLFNIPIPFSLLDHESTCNFLTDAKCPTQPGQSLEYVYQSFVEAILPAGLTVDVEFRIVDEQNNPLTCLRVPITIVEAKSS